MRRKIRKIFWVWDFDREERWLNEMAAKGLNLVSVGFGIYEFEDSTPGEYTIRLEMLEHWPSHPESMQYIRFLEDTGAEQIGSLKRWVYFRKKSAEGAFNLFSDIDSKQKHLRRMLVLLCALLPMLLVGVVPNLHLGITQGSRPNLLIGIITGCLFLLIASGIIKLLRARARLKADGRIRE